LNRSRSSSGSRVEVGEQERNRERVGMTREGGGGMGRKGGV